MSTKCQSVSLLIWPLSVNCLSAHKPPTITPPTSQLGAFHWCFSLFPAFSLTERLHALDQHQGQSWVWQPHNEHEANIPGPGARHQAQPQHGPTPQRGYLPAHVRYPARAHSLHPGGTTSEALCSSRYSRCTDLPLSLITAHINCYL